MGWSGGVQGRCVGSADWVEGWWLVVGFTSAMFVLLAVAAWQSPDQEPTPDPELPPQPRWRRIAGWLVPIAGLALFGPSLWDRDPTARWVMAGQVAALFGVLALTILVGSWVGRVADGAAGSPDRVGRVIWSVRLAATGLAAVTFVGAMVLLGFDLSSSPDVGCAAAERVS